MSNDLHQQLIDYVEKNPNTYARYLPSKAEIYALIKDFPGERVSEKYYNYLHPGEYERFKRGCLVCGKPLKFLNGKYQTYCSNSCAHDVNLRTLSAVDKLQKFGNFKYISGYQGSHSVIKVTNLNCNCTFDVIYQNLFTNPDYCPTHGVERRKKNLSKGLTEEGKIKRRATFEKRSLDKKKDELRHFNKIEKEILSSRFLLREFLKNLNLRMRSVTKTYLDNRFPNIVKEIDNHYGDRFGHRLYNIVNGINSKDDVPKCLNCGNTVNYHSASNKYHLFCSNLCKIESKIPIERSHQTQVSKYGTWHLSTPETAEKKRATCIEKYGVDHPFKNIDIIRKVWRSQYRIKRVTLPSGSIVELMGYEPQVINYLLQTEYTESDFDFHVPSFLYWYDGRQRTYFPDFYIPREKLIIEVKSEWTLKNSIEITRLKRSSVLESGFKYRLIVWDNVLGIQDREI